MRASSPWMPAALKTFLMSSAVGLALPPSTSNRYAAMWRMVGPAGRGREWNSEREGKKRGESSRPGARDDRRPCATHGLCLKQRGEARASPESAEEAHKNKGRHTPAKPQAPTAGLGARACVASRKPWWQGRAEQEKKRTKMTDAQGDPHRSELSQEETLHDSKTVNRRFFFAITTAHRAAGRHGARRRTSTGLGT